MQRPAIFAVFVLSTTLASAQTKKIVVTGFNPEAIRQLQAAAREATVVAAETDKARLLDQVADADAILGNINPELFRAAKKLKWVQIFSAGVESYRFPELLKSDVALTNFKIYQGPEIADHAFALLLALTRGLYKTIPRQKTGEWKQVQPSPIELRGKTAVIVGVGGIGTQIAHRAHAFDMRVIGVDPKDIPMTYFVSKVVPPDRLDSVLPEADVVFISAPLTPLSEGMFNKNRFGLMKKGSHFIVVSRGKLYNSEALAEALATGHLAGAGLDVTNPEPLPRSHALWKLDNVIITPHIAGQSDQLVKRQLELVGENIRRFVNAEPLMNMVDKQKGY